MRFTHTACALLCAVLLATTAASCVYNSGKPGWKSVEDCVNGGGTYFRFPASETVGCPDATIVIDPSKAVYIEGEWGSSIVECEPDEPIFTLQAGSELHISNLTIRHQSSMSVSFSGTAAFNAPDSTGSLSFHNVQFVTTTTAMHAPLVDSRGAFSMSYVIVDSINTGSYVMFLAHGAQTINVTQVTVRECAGTHLFDLSADNTIRFDGLAVYDWASTNPGDDVMMYISNAEIVRVSDSAILEAHAASVLRTASVGSVYIEATYVKPLSASPTFDLHTLTPNGLHIEDAAIVSDTGVATIQFTPDSTATVEIVNSYIEGFSTSFEGVGGGSNIRLNLRDSLLYTQSGADDANVNPGSIFLYRSSSTESTTDVGSWADPWSTNSSCPASVPPCTFCACRAAQCNVSGCHDFGFDACEPAGPFVYPPSSCYETGPRVSPSSESSTASSGGSGGTSGTSGTPASSTASSPSNSSSGASAPTTTSTTATATATATTTTTTTTATTSTTYVPALTTSRVAVNTTSEGPDEIGEEVAQKIYETTAFIASMSVAVLLLLCFTLVLLVLVCRRRAKVVHIHTGKRRKRRKRRDTETGSGEYESDEEPIMMEERVEER